MTIHSKPIHGKQLCFLTGFCPHLSLNNSSPATDHLNRVLTSSLGLEGSSGHPLVDQKLAQFMNRHLSKNCKQESLSTRLPLTGALAYLLGVGFHLGYNSFTPQYSASVYARTYSSHHSVPRLCE